MYLTKGAPRALIDAFSAHNRGGDERSTNPSVSLRPAEQK